MSSHNFRTGRLAKKRFNPQHLYHLLHEMTPAQSSFFRECCLQFLGRPPSEYWGKQKVWFDLPNVDKKTLIYMAEALNHAPHITSDKISRNHKAAAGLASIGKSIAKGAAKAAKYAGKAVKIGMKVYDVLDKVSTGITVAEKLGVVGQDSAIAKANDLFAMVSGAAGNSDSGSGFGAPRLRKKGRTY